MSRKQVSVYCKQFKSRRIALNEGVARKPSTTKADEIQSKVEMLNWEDRRLKIREITLLTGISKSSVHEIVYKLGYLKVSAGWVPQRAIVRIFSLWLQETKRGCSIIPLIRKDWMKWKHPNSPTLKKFKVQQSAKKGNPNCVLGYAFYHRKR